MKNAGVRSFSRALLKGTFSPTINRSGLGFVFDIDGVLLRGSTPLPNARESLQTLLHYRVPFLLLTNGGGELESSKAKKLSKILDIPIHPSQVVLSHTPMKPLCSTLGNSRVLVLGCKVWEFRSFKQKLTHRAAAPTLTHSHST